MSNYETGVTRAQPMTGWVGWIVFASIILMVNGTFNAIQGLAALFRDDVYWETVGGGVLTFNVTAWGWIHLLFGIVMVAVGYLLLKGSTFARVVAIGLVAVNLVAQFAYLSLFPFWAIIAIAIDMFLLYALIVHGDELAA
jgi:hypothetical protein